MRIEETKSYYVICLISHYKLQIQAQTKLRIQYTALRPHVAITLRMQIILEFKQYWELLL